MRVIIKAPEAPPVETGIAGGRYEDLRDAICGEPVSCISHPGVRVWCDDDGLKLPRRALNLIRPSDGAPIYGPVIVVGEDGPDTCGLDDRQVALWMATLALIGVDDADAWRRASLAELVPLVHDTDRAMFEQLRMCVEAEP